MDAEKIYYTEKFNDSFERIFSHENKLKDGRDDDFFMFF